MTLFDAFRKEVLSPSGVAEEAIKRKLKNNNREYVKEHFSELVEQLQIDAYSIYLAEEKRVGGHIIEMKIRERMSPSARVDEVIDIVSSMFGELDRFFLSLTQSRRPRAGSAFEIILKTLFRRLDYPFEEQQVINGRPDFLMPHRAHFDKNAMDCIIFTAKRSLRERWRQIVTEGIRGLGFFLATIDENVSPPQLKEMLNNRIYLVVPKRIKDNIAAYVNAPNVISFETFFMYYLDPAILRWRSAGVV